RHDALREVEHARGFEDQYEAERDQRVEHSGDEALPQRLHQEVGRSAHLHERVDENLVEEVHGRTFRSEMRKSSLPPLRGAKRRSNPEPQAPCWIASLRSQWRSMTSTSLITRTSASRPDRRRSPSGRS